MINEELLPFCECGCGKKVTKEGNRFILGHNVRNKDYHKPKPEPKLCECGCGELANPGNRFIHGHSSRGENNHMYGKKHPPKTIILMRESHTGFPHTPEHCAATSEGIRNSESAKAYHESMCGVPKPPETCARMSKASTGIPKSPEHIAAMRESEAVKDQHKVMIGGNDLVWHHVAYDFLRPKALIVRITRKFHSSIHKPKGCAFSERGYSLID